jgi:hypothetical protein
MRIEVQEDLIAQLQAKLDGLEGEAAQALITSKYFIELREKLSSSAFMGSISASEEQGDFVWLFRRE